MGLPRCQGRTACRDRYVAVEGGQLAYSEAESVILVPGNTVLRAAVLSLPAAEVQFLAGLVGRSPRTSATYRTALGRLHEYLISTGADPAHARTTDFRGDLLERLYLWL